MIDREKVVKELEERIKVAEECMGNPMFTPDAIRTIVALLKEQEAVKPQDAEMLIIHNGGAEEYVKDIESIVLLAHKDYDIVYCGRFSEGR